MVYKCHTNTHTHTYYNINSEPTVISIRTNHDGRLSIDINDKSSCSYNDFECLNYEVLSVYTILYSITNIYYIVYIHYTYR